MTSLLNLMLLLITIKFQVIRTEFSDKEDYFNHSEDALPEFIVDEALFITKKASELSKNPPWITEKTTTARTTRKPTPLAVTFDTRVKWVEPQNFQVIRSNKNNDTYVLPVWSSKSTSKTTAQAPTRATTISTINYLTRTKPTTTAPRRTTKTTAKSTTKSFAMPSVTSTTRKVFTTTTPGFIITYPTKNRLSVVPIWSKMTTPWFSNSPIIQIANNVTAEAMNTTTGISTASHYTATATQPSTKIMTLTTLTTTKTPSLRPFPEANVNRMKPGTRTATATHPTVFLDLTLKRNLRGEKVETEITGETNQTANNPEASHEVKDGNKAIENKLQDKDVIEYQVLQTEPFSKFLELLMKQIAIMDSKYAAKFLRTFQRQFAVLMKTGGFDVLGPITNAYIQDAMNSFQFPIDHKQRLLSMAYNILAHRNDTLGVEMNAILDYMDMLYAVKSEVHMERILNETMAYPNISKTAEEITEGFLEDVLVNPLKRISGTTQGNKLLAAIADIISNKRSNLNARRIFIGSDNDFYKINKKSSHNYRSHIKRRRPKFVFEHEDKKKLSPGERGGKQRLDEARHRNTINVYRKSEGDSNNFSNFDSDEQKMSRVTKNRGKTKTYSLDFVKRGQEILKHFRNVSDEVNNANDNDKSFRASYNTYNNFKQYKMVNNPFRTLLYGKGRKDRFETVYTLKETPNKAYFQRRRPTTKATKPTVELTTNDEKIEYNLNRQLTRESNIYHKQEFQYEREAKKNKNKDFVHELITNEPKSYEEEEFEDSDSDEKFTTTTKIRRREKPKVTEVKSSEKTRSSISIFKNKSETFKDTETTKSEFKEANISLKHFYFKPVITQNKSGDSDEFVSIEFDGEPNVIDFSMKVKLKKPIIQPINYEVTEKQKNTETSETTASSTTKLLRVLNPYKMDNYFKNKSLEHEAQKDKGDDKETSSDDSDLSSSDDSAESEVSLEEGKDSEPHVFGKLRKIKNTIHKMNNLRSKKHGNSKKHHKRKHEKYKGHHKHGKKHKYKYFQAYLKKNSHDRKKRIKHKMKQLKDKRIVGKNFEIAFDAPSGDSENNKLIDVTIVERARNGKRATISLVNKNKKLTSSDSSITNEEEDTKKVTTKKKETSRLSDKGKPKSKHAVKTTRTTTATVATEDYFNLDGVLRSGDHDKDDNENNDHPETANVINDNSHQVTNNAQPNIKGIKEITIPKYNRKAKKTDPNINRNIRKRKKLSPMLIQINTPNVANSRDKINSFEQLKNKVGTVHRRFFPMQVFNDSEYTDEEDELKNNLYDAFRHKDEVYYRRNMRHEIPLKYELKEESDITDEEIILKQNIYKAIKEINRRSYQ